MKKYMLVTPEDLMRLGKCFSDEEEIRGFILKLDDLTKELEFNTQIFRRVDQNVGPIILLKQIFIFSLFCREHIELLHELIHKLHAEEITEEQMKKIKDE